MNEKLPLNPKLFLKLSNHFANRGGVRISGQGRQATITHKSVGGKCTSRVKGGEYYRVNCPHCGDTRHRLWVSYLYGTLDPVTDRQMVHLAVCYNENCDPAQIRDLVSGTPLLGGAVALSPIQSVQRDTPIPEVVRGPGNTMRLTDLPDYHEARTYLTGRGYDPVELDKQWGVRYCYQSDLTMAEGRIIFPVWDDWDGEMKLVGWQARMPGEPVDKDRHPKAYSCPGMRRDRILFNLYQAVHYPIIVVTEGPLDAVRVGPPAVSVFGSMLTDYQAYWLGRRASHAAIVLMLDSDAKQEYWNTSRMHLGNAFAGGVHEVRLKNGDPGDHSHAELWRMISDALYR